MVAEVMDYRVSRVVVHCKDCGQDVGLYPARHKCGISSSETLPPAKPRKYLSAEKTSPSSSSTPDSSQNSKLWSKFLRATALSNNTDSDNESEKDGWEGETHISRILREYYENKGADLPGWLYDSDSTTANNNRRQMTTNLNYTDNNNNNNISLRPNIQPNIYNSKLLTTSPTSMNYPSLPIDRNRDRNIDRIKDRSVPLPKNMESGRYNDRKINNTLPQRGRQPPPNVHPGLMSKKSHQQLRTGSSGYIPTNRSKSVSPNPPSFRPQFISRDIRGNSNPYESDDRGGRGNMASFREYSKHRF